MSDSAPGSAPRFLLGYMEEHKISEAGLRAALAGKLAYYAKLTRPVHDKIGFIAKQFECSRSSAAKAIKWGEQDGR